MRFETVDDALRHQFAGNHFQDMDAFDAIRELASRSEYSDQVRLLNHMGVEAMGLPPMAEAEAAAAIADWLHA